MKIPEVIKWIPAAQPPDSETTVLLFDPHGSEPVWPGYLGENGWFYIDGNRATPSYWAHLPGGPK